MKNTIISVTANIVVILTTSAYGTEGYGVKIYPRGDYHRMAYLEDMPLYTSNVRVAFKRALRATRIAEYRLRTGEADDAWSAVRGGLFMGNAVCVACDVD